MDELITSSGISLDLKEGIPIPLNLSIADFKEPDKRQRNFSKEIELPGTAKNMTFFASAFNLTQIGGVFDYNSSARVNVSYYKRGAPVMPNAVLKLNKVIIVDGKPVFKIGLFSDFVDIFLILSNYNVSDLPWSSYNHTLTKANIQSSWTAPVGTGYYYPLIERNQRIGTDKWKVTDMIPYVHLVDVFKKCMELVGQQYTSTFLTSTRAKSILYGFGGGAYVDNAISPTEQNNRKVLLTNGVMNYSQPRKLQPLPNGNLPAGVNYSQFSLSDPLVTTGLPVITFTETQDLYGQHEPNTFTAQRTGSYKITLQGSIRVNHTGSFTYISSTPIILYYTKNGIASEMLMLTSTSRDQTFTINTSFNIDLSSGDELQFIMGSSYLKFSDGIAQTFITRTFTTPTPLQLTYASLETSLVEGSIVEISRFLPTMKCSEFVVGVIRMFQLMISDPDIYGVVRIEPNVDFYQGTDVFTDITQEVDHSKEIEIRPSANEYAKTLKYLFKKGTETDAVKYADKWKNGYGDLVFDQASFFAKGEQKIELPFGTIIPYQITSQLLVPRFVDVDNAGVKKTTAGVPRIMFRNGMKNGSWRLVGSTTYDFTTYPSVHHFDNWQNPTFDLNFKLVEELMYGATLVTTINTYSVYYHASVNEIISKEGKYVQLYRKMNNAQIEDLDWSKLLMWNGALFKFNKVVDFDSEITEITKIEMIKVLEPKSKNRKLVTPSPKLPALWDRIQRSPANNVATGVSIVHGGKGKQILEFKNAIKG
jgi:hypothetical protein